MEPISLAGLTVLASLNMGMAAPEISPRPAPQQLASATCSLSGQQRVGPRKYCYYNCGETVRTVVIAAGRTCVFTIRR